MILGSTLLVVLTPDNPSPFVLQRAALLARCLGMVIELFVADHSSALDRDFLFDAQGRDRAREGFLNGRRRWLEAQAAQLQSQGVSEVISSTAVWAKSRHSAVLAHVAEREVGAIMLATHVHSLLARAFLSQDDWQMIRETPVPLWLVRDRAWDAHMALGVCVDPVYATDASGRDERLLDMAMRLSTHLPAELHVIHACEVIPTGMLAELDVVMAQDAELHQRVRTRHQEALDHLLADRKVPASGVHLDEGRADRVIPEIVAREVLDLVVMGAVARSGLQRVLMGSTAEQVLDRIDADLLIIK